MITKIFSLNKENIDEDILKDAAKIINEGDLVAFPTETVYGLGADGLNDQACQKIFRAKGRPSDNPLILHISNHNMLYNLVDSISEDAKILMEICWPGPLTLIMKKSDLVPNTVTAGLDTVAIRMPSDDIASKFIDQANTPIAAPSANTSGKPSPTRAKDVFHDLNGKIPMILDGGSCKIGIESTVIDCSEENPVILRPGYFTYEYLKKIIPTISLDDALVSDKKIPKSPGQKYRHYSPDAKMEVFIGENATKIMLEKALKYKEEDQKVGVLTFEDSISNFEDFKTISFGSRDNLSYMSHVLFTALREMDNVGVDIILAEGVSDKDLGKSIMNRMKKSASNNIIYL
ncbi:MULTISPECIES: L-threonylcarbamoyladenylate synthase [Anaerococcus]|uniref:L-threonylcarbamoyladenylate synthase n=1 Tax=Anaerococcus TaxID=165779 RepID=UPI002353D29B|nr:MULTISPECIES: L-threonylcarbamoyladenylate synthase [Anaerococcus]MDU2599139.1 L-threonylcarbamoyladenylate synthase [Anaerococcus sp.]